MCISDWRLGRFIQTNRQNWVIGTGVGLVLPANRQRVGLLVSHDVILTATQGYLASFADGPIVPLNGFMPYGMFTLTEHGSMVQSQVTIAQLNGAAQGTFTEFTLPENYLAAGLEEFRSKYGIV